MVNVTKLAKLIGLVVGGIIAGTSATLAVDQARINRYKKTTKRAQDTCEKALNLAERLNSK